MLSRLITVREQILLSGLALSIVAGAVVLCVHDREMSQTPPSAPLVNPEEPPVTNTLQTVTKQERQTAKPVSQARLARGSNNTPNIKEDKIGVAAMGEVRKPGLYYLPQGARLNDLLETAGGATDEADLSALNLSAALIDTATLTVPKKTQVERRGNQISYRKGSKNTVFNPPSYLRSYSASPRNPTTSASYAGHNAAGVLLDLNSATAEQLDSLPGIGPQKAESILKYRQETRFEQAEDLLNISGIGAKTLQNLRPFITVR